ncbi:uncharacterized protein FA14DRAFT_181858 [Meira miltonrushii]|uniref:Thioesterase/thiol ester dehydrase-isomerase n=1 Tax=Meira miltonrushii TaxID=1280837 RepID=A0A316V303_9BASI|nr:uncharacterized protein FA14DRAFT_181858 [Meira miltonrushii]PWN31936.1 hypothetical protein FA14DRAFT_181858 [Meira miltonrushii]
MNSLWSTLPFASVMLAFVLLFRNSLPFAWTARMMLPFLHLRLTSSKRVSDPNRLPSAHGRNPFEDRFTSKHRATIDECDFMGHLSNSSYPKNLDLARMNYSSDRLADFMLDGGWVPLGSTSFVFHNEIPLLSEYTITSRIETWDDKWLYLRNEFTGKSKKGDNILFCTSITKHCFKHGRKTIAPWFVLAYCGYSSSKDKETSIKANSTRSIELRQSLKSAKSINPLQAYQKSTTARQEPIWCSPEYWDVDSWETERKERLDKLSNAFL